MSDQADEKLLAADKSPSTMPGKKKAKRINNVPLFVGLLLAAGIVGVLAMVMIDRSNQGEWGTSNYQGGGTATNMVEDIVTPGGGLIGQATPPPMPDYPPPPEPVVMVREEPPARPEVPLVQAPVPVPVSPSTDPAPDPETQEQRQERQRLRQRKIQLTEAAVGSDLGMKVSGEAIRRGAEEAQRQALQSELQRSQMQLAALQGQAPRSYSERVAEIRAATEGRSGTEVNFNRRGNLTRSEQFAGDESRWTRESDLHAPPSMFIIRTGAVIPATLISGINSDLPGQIIGQVAQDVYDTPTGKHVLIPQGSRLVGEYSSEILYGQSRVFAVWQRIIYPDGKSLDLGAMPASTGDGYAGLRDKVNNHYIRLFGSALMMSAILAGVEMTQNKDNNNNNNNNNNNSTRMSDALSESLGQVLGGVMAEMMQKNLSISPTLEVRPGFRLNVMIVKDLIFTSPYRAFDYAAR